MLPQNYSEIFENGNELHLTLQVYYACNITFTNGLGMLAYTIAENSQLKFGKLIQWEATISLIITHTTGFVS